MSSPRNLAVLVSSVISEVVVLVMLLLFSSSSPTTPNSTCNNDDFNNNLVLLSPSLTTQPLHLLTDIIAVAASILSDIINNPTDDPSSSSSSSSSPSRKRKRTRESMDTLLLPLFRDNPDPFKICFRMKSSSFEWLSGLLEPLLECHDPVGSSLNLSPDIRLALGLFRLTTGSPYPDISRRFRVSESTSRFCTKQLCRVLCTNFRFWVSFPSSDLHAVSAPFHALTGLPNCCGVIHCARFHHHTSTIATQLVVDSSSKILSIATGFRGDKGDFRVLKSSTLYKDIQGGELLSGAPVHLKGVDVPRYLIGGGGDYPLLPWLMLPFAQNQSPAAAAIPSFGKEEQEAFNAAHESMRDPALTTVASLRNWGILSSPIIQEEDISMAVACIAACSILHNALLIREDYSALLSHPQQQEQEEEEEHSLVLVENNMTTAASLIRSALATTAKEFSDSTRQL